MTTSVLHFAYGATITSSQGTINATTALWNSVTSALVDGERAFAVVEVDSSSATCTPFTAGWTLEDSGVVGSRSWFLFSKTAGPSEGTTQRFDYTPNTVAGAVGLIGASNVVGEVVGAVTESASSTTQTGASITVPSGTSTAAAGIWIGSLPDGVAWQTPSPGTGLTTFQSFVTNFAAGRPIAVSMGRWNGISPGVLADQVSTSGGGSGDGVGILFAFSNQPLPLRGWVVGAMSMNS